MPAAACSLLRPCGLAGATPFGGSARRPALRRQPSPPCAAGEPGPSTSGSGNVSSKEQEVERLEAAIRGKAAPSAAPRPPSAGMAVGSSGAKSKPKQIPIRGMVQSQRKVDSQYENMAEWKEGQLFPEGWDSMPLGQKLNELYLGRRGVIFWLNKAAFASVFVVLGGWVLFRFVGPNLGLYTLQSDLTLPPL